MGERVQRLDGSRGGGNAESETATWVPVAVGLLGVASFVEFTVEWAVFNLPEGVTVRTVGSFTISALVAVAFVYGGYYLHTSDLGARRYPRVAKWCLGGLLGFLVVNLVIMAATPAATLEGNVGWARGTAVFGALGGLGLGLVEARSIERAERAERANVRAEYADAQRQWFDYLNALLRHEVLNKATVVDGYAALLEADVDDAEARERIAVIRRNTAHMTSVIEDVRVILQSVEDDAEFHAVDVSAALRDVAEEVHAVDREVSMETSIPDGVTVLADDLLVRVFSNLVRNAVEHNDGETAHVSVSLETADDEAVVRVADDGPGIAESERAELFERGTSRGSTHGLGLYLVHRLVERYGGTVELTETGPSGSVFTVRLPLADGATARAVREPAAA